MTMQANNTTGSIPVAAAICGTIGNNAGQTTPKVLEKKLIIAAIAVNAIGNAQASTKILLC